MEITKYGTVTISKDEVMATGFTIDGSLGDQLFPNAESIIVAWAIERLTENLDQGTETKVT